MAHDPRVMMLIQRFRPTFTGHGIQVERMASLLTEGSTSVEIVTGEVPGAPAREPGSVPVHRFPLPVTRNPLALRYRSRRFLNYLSQRAPHLDLLHVHGSPGVLPFARPHAHRLGLATVVTTTLLDSDDPVTVAGQGRLAAWRFGAYRGADRFVAICPALVDRFPRAGIDPGRVSHIPVGVDIERFRPAPDRDALARELGLAGKLRVLFTGIVLRRKGVDLLLDAWERVAARIPEAHLHVVGGHQFDPVREKEAHDFAAECLARAEAPPLAGRVTFHGRRHDLHQLVPAAHVFLFPSRLEGFPNVVLEALASGTPPVVTRIAGSTDESVRDGETGYVVEQEDAAGLAEKTELLLSQGDLRESFSGAARADAEKRYALPIVAHAHLEMYRAILAARG
jgi:glycosyltransferase involved in cell wall biosynthesis